MEQTTTSLMRWSSRAIWEEVNGASCVSLATRNLKTLSTLFTFEFHLLFRWCVFCEYYGGYSIVWRWIRNLSSFTSETGIFFLYLHDWNYEKWKEKSCLTSGINPIFNVKNIVFPVYYVFFDFFSKCTT